METTRVEKVVLEDRVGKCKNATQPPNGYIMYLEFIKNGEVAKCYYASSCREYIFPNLYYEKVNIYLSGALPNISYEHSQTKGHVCLTVNQSGYQFVHSLDLSNVKVLKINTALWLDHYIKDHSKWEGNCIKRPGGMEVDTLSSPRVDYEDSTVTSTLEEGEECSRSGGSECSFYSSEGEDTSFSDFFYLIKNKNPQS